MKFMKSKPVRLAILLCVSVVAGLIAISQVGIVDLGTTLSRIPAMTLLAVAALMLTGALVATLRFYFIARDLGWKLSAKDTLLALGVGQLAGAASVQFFGQIVARSAILAPRGLSAPVNVAIAIYERLAAVGVSITLAAIGAWYLFGRITVDLRSGGDQFLFIAAGIVIAVISGAVFGWGRMALRAMRGKVNARSMLSFARAVSSDPHHPAADGRCLCRTCLGAFARYRDRRSLRCFARRHVCGKLADQLRGLGRARTERGRRAVGNRGQSECGGGDRDHRRNSRHCWRSSRSQRLPCYCRDRNRIHRKRAAPSAAWRSKRG